MDGQESPHNTSADAPDANSAKTGAGVALSPQKAPENAQNPKQDGQHPKSGPKPSIPPEPSNPAENVP
jgi:hypothetical protein